jgi:hypothetical protein
MAKILVLPLLLLDGSSGLDLDVVGPSLFFVGAHCWQRRRRRRRGANVDSEGRGEMEGENQTRRGFEENGGSVCLPLLASTLALFLSAYLTLSDAKPRSAEVPGPF